MTEKEVHRILGNAPANPRVFYVDRKTLYSLKKTLATPQQKRNK